MPASAPQADAPPRVEPGPAEQAYQAPTAMRASDGTAAWPSLATGVLITMVVIVFARLAYGLLLPGMRTDLGLSFAEAANLASASALGYLCLVLAAGALAARRGARFAVMLGITLVTAGFAGMALSSRYPFLVAFMVLLGIGTAFSYTPAVSLLAANYPQRRGLVIGLMSSGVGIGMLAVGLLAPQLDAAFGAAGWRWNWCLFALVGAVCLAAAARYLPRSPGGKPGAGGLLSSAGAAAVLRNRRVITVGLLYGITGVIYIAQATFMYSFALESGLTPAVAGGLAAAMGMLSIPAGPAWGIVSDRIGRPRGILLTLSIALLATAAPLAAPGLAAFAIHYAVLGLTLAGLFTSILAAASEEVEPAQAPLAVSYVTFFFAAGQLLGPVAGGWLVEGTGEMRWVFVFTCFLMVLGIALARCYQLTHRGRSITTGG